MQLEGVGDGAQGDLGRLSGAMQRWPAGQRIREKNSPKRLVCRQEVCSAFTVPDFGPHPTFLAAEFAAALTRLLGSHAALRYGLVGQQTFPPPGNWEADLVV